MASPSIRESPLKAASGETKQYTPATISSTPAMIHKTRDRVLFINDILSKDYIIESVGQRRERFYLISTVDLEGN